MTKKLFLKTFGCQMNVYDSSRMVDTLKPLGYELVDAPEEAHMVIVNTCHIREKAAEKLFSLLGRLKAMKLAQERRGERMIIGVAGCVAQAEGDAILERAPYVDMVFGPQTYHLLPQMVAEATRKVELETGEGRGVLNLDFPEEAKFDHLPAPSGQGASAYLSIQEGCDKFCHFCCVPYTRGAEYSRPVFDIVQEARQLVDKGAKDITLLGQNVNAYHGEGKAGSAWGLGRLMGELAQIKGLERLRYTTSHPQDMDQELIEAHRDIPEVMPYLHLPVQSGSDRILKAMNRKHTADHYRHIIEELRKARPDIALTSDFIVGYPGETDEDFEETLQLVKDIDYAMAYSFIYSKRAGTPAATLPNQVPADVSSQRLVKLQNVLQQQQLAFNQKSVGKIVPVLFEDQGKLEGQLLGRSPYLQRVHAHGAERLLGEIVDVKIHSAGLNSLIGDIVTAEYDSHSSEAVSKKVA